MQQTGMNNDIILFSCKSVSGYYFFRCHRDRLALNIVSIHFSFFLKFDTFEFDENEWNEAGD